MRTSVERFLTVALAFLALLFAACGGASDAPTSIAIRPAPTAEATATPAPSPTPTATVIPENIPAAPTEGRWIEVDVTNFVVRLMQGAKPLTVLYPVAVGEQVDTGIYESTQTGLFHVYNKAADRVYDAPYDTYIAWWVGFDPEKDNGFHSFLLDAAGNVVDDSTGRVSNGCIRTGDPETLFNFAEIGMPVLVHS